jgi:hypothetical protein
MNKKYKPHVVFYTIPIDNFVLLGMTLHWDTTVEGSGQYMLDMWNEGAHLLNEKGSCTAYTQGINSKVIAEKWSPTYFNYKKNMKKMLDPNNSRCPGLGNL